MRRNPIWYWLAVGLLGLFSASSSVFAFRLLPDDVQYGNLEGIDRNSISISGKVYRIAPGSRIRDRNNRIVVPASAPRTGMVAFNLDYLGQVLGVWILTPQEAAAAAERIQAR